MPLKLMIWGYPYFRKPPNIYIYIYIHIHIFLVYSQIYYGLKTTYDARNVKRQVFVCLHSSTFLYILLFFWSTSFTQGQYMFVSMKLVLRYCTIKAMEIGGISPSIGLMVRTSNKSVTWILILGSWSTSVQWETGIIPGS